MKRLIYAAGLIFLLASCDQVVFTEPQPSKVKCLGETPTMLQGLYLDQDKDTLFVSNNSFTYISGDFIYTEDLFLSDSVVLKAYRGKYFFNRRLSINGEYFWVTYIIDPLNDGVQLDVYVMDPGDVVRLAKLQEITPKVRDIEGGDSDNEYYLFSPGRKDYKKILADSIFSKMVVFNKISSPD